VRAKAIQEYETRPQTADVEPNCTRIWRQWKRKGGSGHRNFDDSRHLQATNDGYLLKLKRIREAKPARLAAEGVREKCIGDLRKKRFVVR
jgi:hypothetical protein